MLAKYSVEFTISFRRHQITQHYRTDDPIALEEFIVELLEKGYRVEKVLHEGIPLPQHEADKIIKIAATLLAAKHLRLSLGMESGRFRGIKPLSWLAIEGGNPDTSAGRCSPIPRRPLVRERSSTPRSYRANASPTRRLVRQVATGARRLASETVTAHPAPSPKRIFYYIMNRSIKHVPVSHGAGRKFSVTRLLLR